MVRIGYQLYSAREEAAQDLEKTLRELSDLGYEGVEFAGFYGKSAQEVRALLDAHGLEALSSHVALEWIEEDMFGVIAFHQAIGCRRIAVPYLLDDDRPGQQGFGGCSR